MRKFILKNLLILVVLALIVTVFSSSVLASKNLKFGAVVGTDDNLSRAAAKFIEVVEEKTDGEIEISYFPGSQLGTASQQLESLRMGELDFFVGGVGWYSELVGGYNLWAAGFVMESYEHGVKVMESEVGQNINNQLLDNYGIRMIDGTWYRAPRNLFTSEDAGPVNSVEDVQDLVLRVPELQAFTLPWNEAGASATPIPYGDLYMALEQGVADAFEGPVDLSYYNKMHEPIKYVNLVNYQYEVVGLVMADRAYQDLSDEEVAIINEAAAEAKLLNNEIIKESEENVLELMEEEGKIINRDVDRESFFEALKDVPYIFEEEGLWEEGIYDKVKEMAN